MERSPRGGSRLPIGAGRLQYKLDGDSAHTRVFGDATNSTVGGHGLIALNVLGLDPTATRHPRPRLRVADDRHSRGVCGFVAVTLTYS